RDRGPDRAADVREIFDRRLDGEGESLDQTAIDDPAWARLDHCRRCVARGGWLHANEKARDLVERPLRRRESDALRGARGEAFEALEGEREMRTALCPRDRVNLVDDH